MYTAVLSTRTLLDTADLLTALDGYHPVVAPARTGHVRVTISLPAQSLRQAILSALAVVEVAADGSVTTVEVSTSEDFDARAGLQPLPELLSVTQVAEQLGVTRQAVLERLERGTLTGAKVGKTWVIQAGALRPARP